MALTSLLLSTLLALLASVSAEIRPSQLAVTAAHLSQAAAPPPPPLYSVEELWELCERFPSLDQCEVLGNGAVPGAASATASAPMMAEKRKSAYMRFGRSDPALMGAEMEKRKSAYMRFGKRSGQQSPLLAPATVPEEMDVEKRKSAYMRFGKRKSAYMRFGKRSGGMGMAPRWSEDMAAEVAKRKSAYMRFGK